MENAISRNQ